MTKTCGTERARGRRGGPAARLGAALALLAAGAALSGCVYDPYTGTYVACCTYPYAYPYPTYVAPYPAYVLPGGRIQAAPGPVPASPGQQGAYQPGYNAQPNYGAQPHYNAQPGPTPIQ